MRDTEVYDGGRHLGTEPTVVPVIISVGRIRMKEGAMVRGGRIEALIELRELVRVWRPNVLY